MGNEGKNTSGAGKSRGDKGRMKADGREWDDKYKMQGKQGEV